MVEPAGDRELALGTAKIGGAGSSHMGCSGRKGVVGGQSLKSLALTAPRRVLRPGRPLRLFSPSRRDTAMVPAGGAAPVRSWRTLSCQPLKIILGFTFTCHPR